TRGAGRTRDDRRLDEPLQIERDVVALAPEAGNRLEQRRAAARATIVDDDPAIDDRHEIEDLAVLRADEPVDPRLGIGAAQRRRHRNGMYDVAERTQADDEDSGHVALIWASSSRVAWL